MREYVFDKILDEYKKERADKELKGKIPLVKNRFIHEIRRYDGLADAEGVYMDTVQITFSSIMGESELGLKWDKFLAGRQAERLFFREMWEKQRLAEREEFLAWALPLQENNNKLITIDESLNCVWLQAGGDNYHTVWATIRGSGGLSSGGYHNARQNPSAYSLEKAVEMIASYKKPRLKKNKVG